MKLSSIVAVALAQMISSVYALPEGLVVETLVPVAPEDCYAKVEVGDTISVHYVGSLEDGYVFDSSIDRGQPITFPIGVGRVIPGWDQGLIGLCVGEKVKLTIPPELAYGEQGVGPIPPSATLTFESQIVGIEGKKPPAPEAEVEEEEEAEEGVNEEEDEEEVHDEL
ncbi:immunophilin [Scheffersomyces amazonensis]|uniref:immunophilin n=1 Tax=Scheffersomyces amazonensis TaxID=1078765 RepID=UPI00315D723F